MEVAWWFYEADCLRLPRFLPVFDTLHVLFFFLPNLLLPDL